MYVSEVVSTMNSIAVDTTLYPKYTTDYGVLMELFLDVMIHQDKELAHKSFIKKITNKLQRYHKNRQGSYSMCAISELRGRKAIDTINKQVDSVEISIGALCWLIYNKHKEELQPYGFNVKAFEELNRYYNVQGVIMQTARVLSLIEGELR